MRFREIPKFTYSGGYSIDVSLSRLANHISEYEAEGLQMNPDFQRGHIWTEQQQIAYVEYLFRGGRSGLDIYLNHPSWQSGGEASEGEFVCVDGLQRVTACLRFMQNEIPIFGTYLADFEDTPSDRIKLSFHFNDLKTRSEVLNWYLEMNFAGTPHSQEELSRVQAMLEKGQ